MDISQKISQNHSKWTFNLTRPLNLADNINKNIDRYTDSGFDDLSDEIGWGIKLKSVQIDVDMLQELDGEKSPEAEVKNSLLVWNALKGMTPAVACEERVWARLSHIECFQYAKKRWLDGKDALQIPQQVEIHFFAKNKRGRWKENAISRLWWNAYVANLACPNRLDFALQIFLQKADIKDRLLEKTYMISRPQIAGGAIRAFISDEWLTSNERNWRGFITTVNKYGGGMFFEAMNDEEIDAYMKKCADIARKA